MNRSRVFELCSSRPSSHKIRLVIQSSVSGNGSSGRNGSRLLKMVPLGISWPIFSPTLNWPRGVLLLPSSEPRPKRDVETGNERIVLPSCVTSSFCFSTETWIVVWALFTRSERTYTQWADERLSHRIGRRDWRSRCRIARRFGATEFSRSQPPPDQLGA